MVLNPYPATPTPRPLVSEFQSVLVVVVYKQKIENNMVVDERQRVLRNRYLCAKFFKTNYMNEK